MSTLINDISEIVIPIIEKINGFLIEIGIRGDENGKIIEIYVDTETGITMDECALISRKVFQELEQNNAIEGRYRLDVSSPDLGKPIKVYKQYQKNIGRHFTIITVNEEKKQNIIKGILEQCSNDVLYFLLPNKKKVEIKLDSIKEAYIIPQFK